MSQPRSKLSSPHFRSLQPTQTSTCQFHFDFLVLVVFFHSLPFLKYSSSCGVGEEGGKETGTKLLFSGCLQMNLPLGCPTWKGCQVLGLAPEAVVRPAVVKTAMSLGSVLGMGEGTKGYLKAAQQGLELMR
uniref:Uncharacterized protein n=1 Tax=Mus musculus TaxID=10090 RepID=Q8C8P9_MOUSE|nr:unnamed protein product [Mus musculus]